MSRRGKVTDTMGWQMLLGGAAMGAGAGLYWLGRTPVGVRDGASLARAVESDGVLPDSVDVVVIGGGIVGTATALTLAERGVSVALCEKGEIAGEASGRAMGYIDSQYADPVRLPLLLRNRELWRGINARTGLETGYREPGIVTPLGSEEEEAAARAWIEGFGGSDQLTASILGAADVKELFPNMIDPPATALHTPQDGSVEPVLAAPALAEAARRHGAVILQRCAVRGLETTGGQVSGVVTEKGRIACRSVVVAGGYWTPRLLRGLGITLDQFDIFLSMMRLAPVNGPDSSLAANGYGFRPQIDGRYSFGVVDFAAPIMPVTLRNLPRLRPAIEAFWPMSHPGLSISMFWDALTEPRRFPLDRPTPYEKCRVLVPDFRAGPLENGLKALRHHFPQFADAEVEERWAGAISTTIDNLPVISEVPGMSGLFVGSGFSYGLTYGLGAGEALADLATGRSPQIDLAPYRFGRFSDGSVLRYHA